MLADAQWFEQVVVTVPCRPDLNQQPGFIKLRRPTAIVSGNSSGASGIPGGDVDHNSYRLVYMNFNTLRVFTKEVQSGSEEGNPPVDFFNDGLLPITFGAPFMIHLGASADSRTVLYSEGSSASASSAAVAIWEGIEAAYDQNGVQIPCLGCLAFPCPTCDVVEVCSPFVPPPACPGDTNNDGATDAADLSVLLATFGSQVAPYSGADYNGDAQVTGADLSVLLSNFGCDVTP
jgi:hypothetical protein